jgi:hypothetical protein
MHSGLLIALCIGSATLVSRAAVTLYQSESFDTLGGWTSGAPNPVPPVLQADSGPDGPSDSALRITANGSGSGPGGKLVVFNRTNWTGDFTGAGIVAITADLRNLGTAGDLAVRLAFNGPGGWFVTGIAPAPRFGGWIRAEFDLSLSALTAVSGGSNAAATMAGVTEMRILHSSAADHQGSVVSGILLVDQLNAVPEPSTLGLLAGSLLVFLKRKR